MASIRSLAVQLARRACNDAAFAVKLREANDANLLGVVDGDSQVDIFSGTKNGSSYQGRVGLTQEERRIAIGWVVTYLDTGYFPGAQGLNRFNTGSDANT